MQACGPDLVTPRVCLHLIKRKGLTSIEGILDHDHDTGSVSISMFLWNSHTWDSGIFSLNFPISFFVCSFVFSLEAFKVCLPFVKGGKNTKM